MKAAKSRYELWALHEKFGRSPWRRATWFVPISETGTDETPAQYTKRIAKYLTDSHRKYKAVRYTP